MLRTLPRLSLAARTTPDKQQLFKYLVYAPDCNDKDGLQRRLAVRPRHIVHAVDSYGAGHIKMGGAFLSSTEHPSPPSDASSPPPFAGSILVLAAESLESARSIVEADPYYKEGVWDREKLEIRPFLEFPLAQEHAKRVST